jgi:FkbM family methyltransferase
MAITHAEHPVFREFDRYTGEVEPGFRINFLGQRTNPAFGAPSDAFRQWLRPGQDVSEASAAEYPPVSEESFEWIAVLEAVLEAHATFTMLELGAGYGRWMVAAVCAARQKLPDLTCKLIGVEAEPTHFGYMRQHFLDNGVDPREHTLIEAAVNATGKPVTFIVGHSEEWYGQSIMQQGSVISDYPTARIIRVPAVRLVDLLKPHKYVDIIDADIQGTELEVITSSITAMTKKVRRAYISTHSAAIHTEVAQAFTTAGWKPRALHGWTGEKEEETKFGPISFVDGIQYWLNPHITQRRETGTGLLGRLGFGRRG